MYDYGQAAGGPPREDNAMITAMPRMTNLFLQLGLDSSQAGIDRFLLDNELPGKCTHFEAPFLTDQVELGAARTAVLGRQLVAGGGPAQRSTAPLEVPGR